jgi:hypothetical protein
MRRIATTTKTREECLGRAIELEWMADNSPSPAGAAYAWDQARLWRSLALLARPAEAYCSKGRAQPAESIKSQSRVGEHLPDWQIRRAAVAI